MDTIIYFYKKRDLSRPAIDTWQMKDYLLVRVGMNVGENRWFVHSLTPPMEIPAELEQSLKRNLRREQDSQQGQQPKQKLTLRKWWQVRRKRHEAIQLQRRQQEQFQKETAEASLEIQGFLTELSRFVDDRYDCRCVYGDAVKKYLTLPGEREQESPSSTQYLPRLWKEYWHFPEFDAFFQIQWVEPLLMYARLHHFLVLGTAPCMDLVLSNCASRMKSLRWFLAEEACTEELQDLVEDFYEDYGLAIDLHPLEGKRVFTRLLLETRNPVCVLDFSGEPRVPTSGLARGSIWIDFASVEEKAHRISERGEGIAYFSMKETWKRAGKP